MKVGQIHEGRYAGGELDPLFLHQFAFGFIVALLGGELLWPAADFVDGNLSFHRALLVFHRA